MPDDPDSDHQIVDEMLGPYRGMKYDGVPPDPRRIDVARMAALRERLASPYSYRWREREANLEIALALFDGRAARNGDVIRLCHGFHLEDARGHGPPITRSPISWGEAEGYHRRYFVTVAICGVRNYIGDLTMAEALLGKVLPGWGYAMRLGPEGRRLRLARGEERGAARTEEPPARALVIAMLERLEHHPEEAAPWRSMP